MPQAPLIQAFVQASVTPEDEVAIDNDEDIEENTFQPIPVEESDDEQLSTGFHHPAPLTSSCS